jgi:hypothetical protein
MSRVDMDRRLSPNIVEQLRGLCSPDAERMSDYQRINLMVTAGHAAADRIQELEGALRDALCELSACAEQMGCKSGGSVHRAQIRARAALEAKHD